MLLSVRVPDYPLAVILDGCEPTTDVPLLVADRGRVIALDDRARSYGARVGQTVTQAAAAAANARIVVHDAARAATRWEEFLDALDAVTPLVEDVYEGVALLDMHGIAGSVPLWCRQIRQSVARLRLPVRIGAGSNRFCAYAAGYIGDGVAIEAGNEAATLAPLPLEVLALDANARQRLELLGITTLGELARLPHGPFVRRFGRAAACWHEWSRGIDRTPFLSRGHAVTIEASMFGEGAAESEEAVLFAMRVLLSRVCSDLGRCGRRASELEVGIEFENGHVETIEVLLAAATANERDMLDVVRAKLEGRSFEAALCGLRVRASRLEAGGEALPLVRNDDIDPQNVAVVLARIEAILGEPVRRARTQAAHVCEERFTYEPFTLSSLRERTDRSTSEPAAAGTIPQLRLLRVAEVDVRVARGTPAFVGTRRIVNAVGPWRIDDGWFSSRILRDEYDVVLEDGTAYRIYHQGSRWYLRGAYD